MSDENNARDTGDPELIAAPSVGSQLKVAREARQMSVGDIAMALKLTSRQVEALENGHWQGLPGQTFIRGFVRNYARLLHLDPAPLMTQLDTVLVVPQQHLNLPGDKLHVAMPQAGRSHRRDYAMVLAGLILLSIAGVIYFMLPAGLSDLQGTFESLSARFAIKRETASPTAAISTTEPVFPPDSTPQQVMNPQAAVPEAANAPASPAGLVPPPVQQEAIPPTAVTQPAPTMPGPTTTDVSSPSLSNPQPLPSVTSPASSTLGSQATLRFSFSQESWIEVRDRHGKMLLSKLGRPGMEHGVDGPGPFAITIGNAPGVQLSLRGRPVDLATHSQGKVARLMLE